MTWNLLASICIYIMITKEQVEHIAKLSRIKLTDTEVEKYQQDLSEVLDYFDILKQANTKGIEPMTHLVLNENEAREDVSRREDPKIIVALLKLVPFMKEGFLKVKTILLK